MDLTGWEAVIKLTPILGTVVVFGAGMVAGHAVALYRLRQLEDKVTALTARHQKLDETTAKRFEDLAQQLNTKLDGLAGYIRKLLYESGGMLRYVPAASCQRERDQCHLQHNKTMTSLVHKLDDMDKKWERLITEIGGLKHGK